MVEVSWGNRLRLPRMLTVRQLPRGWLAGALVASALFAAGVALFSSNPLHQLWGAWAACSYAAAAGVAMAWRSRTGVDVALGAIVCGAILVPLVWMAWHGEGQPEVNVVVRSASLLIHHGTPYEAPNVLAKTTDPNAYNPYLPVMAVFGLPQALFGGNAITDPRVWFGVVFLVVFAFALRVGGARDYLRWAVLMTASPIIAFELAVGGTDVPMVAFMCLGFAFLWRPGAGRRAGAARRARWQAGRAAVLRDGAGRDGGLRRAVRLDRGQIAGEEH